ncbi:UNVERIFIED_CONTAM: hypothetical protein FKN15_074172 [Acipenser sinensis]
MDMINADQGNGKNTVGDEFKDRNVVLSDYIQPNDEADEREEVVQCGPNTLEASRSGRLRRKRNSSPGVEAAPKRRLPAGKKAIVKASKVTRRGRDAAFSCDLCKSPFVTHPARRGSRPKTSTSSPSPRYKTDPGTGLTRTLCNACGLSFEKPKHAPASVTPIDPAEWSRHEQELQAFSQSMVQLLGDQDARRLCCPVFANKPCLCLQSYIKGAGLSFEKPKHAPASVTPIDPAEWSRHEQELQAFSQSMVQLLGDQDARRLCCPVFANKPCLCLQSYIKGAGDNMLEYRSRALRVLSLLKEAKELGSQKCYDPRAEPQDGKSKKQDWVTGSESPRSLQTVLTNRKVLREELKLCERATQRILGYSINFLHKRLKTDPQGRERVQRTKGKSALGLLKPILDLSKERCCMDNCVVIVEASTSLNLRSQTTTVYSLAGDNAIGSSADTGNDSILLSAFTGSTAVTFHKSALQDPTMSFTQTQSQVMAVASLPPSLLVQAEPSLCSPHSKTLLSDLPQSLSTLSTCSLISGDNQLIMQNEGEELEKLPPGALVSLTPLQDPSPMLDTTVPSVPMLQAHSLGFSQLPSDSIPVTNQNSGGAIAEKPESDIIQRLSLSKQQRHEDAVSNLQQELILLSEDFEPMFMEAGEALLDRLSESDGEIQQVFQKIENDSDLERFTLEGLHNLWDSITHISLERRKWIKDLDETCISYESKRAARIGNILKAYTGTLEKISYLMPSDVYRFIDKESMMLNQALLANRRAVGKLYVNLMERDLKRELSERRRWKERLQDWKTIKRQAALVKFNNFMSSIRNHEPEAVQRELDLMRKTQELMSERRMKILLSLSDISPPQCTKSMASEWNSSLSAINEQIDAMHIDYMKRIHSHYENLWQDCLEEVEKFKEEMLSNHVLSQKDIQYIVNNELLQLVGSCQRQREGELEAMEKEFEVLANTTRDQNKALLKFARGAAKEASLDILMDKLRQESTEETLKSAMEKTFSYLEEIKTSLRKNIGMWLLMSGSLATLGVKLEKHKRRSTSAAIQDVLSRDKKRSTTTAVQSGSLPKRVNTQSPKKDASPVDQKDDFQTTVFTTSSGNPYTLTCPEDVMCEYPSQGKPPPYIETVVLTSSLLSDLIRRTRQEFFEHMEHWFDKAMSNSMNIVAAKKDELKSELELRYHLHQPRAQRIEMDIHNVRAAELVLHRERVDRHCTGVIEGLNNVKSEFVTLRAEQKKLTEGFRKYIYDMEDVFVNATKSEWLASLCDSLHTDLDKHMGIIRASLRQFREKQETTLGKLRDSNAEFIKSVRLFSEGGNFTPDEFEVFRKRLDKISGRIDNTEEFVMLELEGMESKCLGQATEVVHKFEDKFHNLTVDLNFIEKIQRFLINTQVKMKLEVTKSNYQAESLSSYLEQFQKKIDACAKPRVDKETVTPDELYSFTQMIMEEFKKRSTYLDCLLDLPSASSVPEIPLQGPFAAATRSERQESKVGSQSCDSLLQPSRMGKPATEDAALGVIHSILQTQKSKVYLELEKAPEASGVQLSSPHSPSTTVLGNKKSHTSSINLKTDILLRKASSAGHFKGIVWGILWESNDALLLVAEEFYKKKEKRTITRPEYIQETFENSAEMLNQKLLSYHSQAEEYHNVCLQDFREQLKQFEQQLYHVPPLLIAELTKKHLDQLAETTTQIHHSLHERLQESINRQTEHWDSLRPTLGHPGNLNQLESLCNLEQERLTEHLTAIDISKKNLQEFYKKKEKRTITRPEYIQETFENSAEMLNQKLLSYHSQAEEYHNVCLQDFREQLKQFEQQLYHVPPLLIAELTKKHLDQLAETTTQIHHSLHERLQESINRQTEHWESLRPTLGHPGNLNQLESLCNLEQERLTEHLTAVDISKKNLQDCVIKHGEDFVTALASLTENMLLKLDDFLTVDDIQTGTVEVTKAKTTTLIRRKKAGLPLEDRVYIPLTQRGSRTWPGILYCESRAKINDEKLTRETASIKTAKTTLGHVSAMEARDSAYQKYQREYEKELARTEDEPEAQRISATHQETRWKESVLKIKQLYS